MRFLRNKRWQRLAATVITASAVAVLAPAAASANSTPTLVPVQATYAPGATAEFLFSVSHSIAHVYARLQQGTGTAGAIESEQLELGADWHFMMTAPSKPGRYTVNLYDYENFSLLASTSFDVVSPPPAPLSAMLMVPNAGSDATNNPDIAAATEVRQTATRYNTVILYQQPGEPAGSFKIEDALTHECLADDSPSGRAYWEDCLEGTSFYIAPALRGYGYFIKVEAPAEFDAESPHNAPSYCLSNNGQDFASSSWTPQVIDCKDGIDGADPLSTAGSANPVLSSITWNFYNADGTPLPESTALPEVPASSSIVKKQPNVIKVCNWAAMVIYYSVDYTLNDGASQSYKSGTYDVGQCGELDLPAGYISATVTVVVQMEGVGSWAPMEATTFIGWSTDATIQVHGDICSDWADVTALYRNDAASFTTDPGTDCSNDTTKGQPHTATYEDMWNFIMSMNPLTAFSGTGAPSLGMKMGSLSAINVSKFGIGASSLGTNLYRLGYYAARAVSK